MYLIQHYVIKFVIDLRQVSGFLRELFVSSTNKIDHHDIAEMLLKVALSIITHNPCIIQNTVKSHKKGICVERKTGVKCDFELICYKPIRKYNIFFFASEYHTQQCYS